MRLHVLFVLLCGFGLITSALAQKPCPSEGQISSSNDGKLATIQGIPPGITYYVVPATGEDLVGLMGNADCCPTTKEQLYVLGIIPAHRSKDGSSPQLRENPNLAIPFLVAQDQKPGTCRTTYVDIDHEKFQLTGGGIMVQVKGEKIIHLIWKIDPETGNKVSAFDQPVKVVIMRVDKK